MSKRQKHWLLGLGTLVVLVIVALIGASLYFYNLTVARGKKSFIGAPTVLKTSDPLYTQKHWFQTAHKYRWTEKAADAHFKLVADYVPAAKATKKTVVLVHGFASSKEQMGGYAGLFHQLGYNVLVPDDRAQGQSGGQAMSYGYFESRDYLKWINQVIARQGKQSQIVLFGVSMGGATTMMASGQKTPTQLKAYIEDCGYTTADAEIRYQAKQMYNLPYWPMVPLTSAVTKLKAGFSFKQADALSAVKKNHKPMLFIHGGADTFVPTKMVYQVYRADAGPKQLLVVPGAKHAASYSHSPKTYAAKVKAFLAEYVK
ncbi:alpha/beta hydrolase [Levilactobacillus spicheri]|uniref:Alpha/beta hydrolase n=2 Tax=Levilactobacillus spicheri TaxID=216463 RepID=A0ABQ0WST7_9LACO|nr:alpha/beta hydrolase [Levilactobacillus spicheri]KRL47416.1 alpha beta hydrolase [Levilactobacillus spicheri DSM 15429]GEO67844.1 alpha/beta hydrolase [Levilactobacillus spicheri]